MENFSVHVILSTCGFLLFTIGCTTSMPPATFTMNHANSSVSEATHQPTIGKPVTAGRVLKRPQATTTAAPVKTPAKSSPKSRPSIGNWCKLLDKSFSNFCAHSTRTRSFVFKCGNIKWKKLAFICNQCRTTEKYCHKIERLFTL
ncbi:uncharacterized protein LOC143459643 [Clavelina lepadiformis]|uniref:uncharacterized protein LOC143459643 n=1 Tax=Clavelina lepadiformis TaxID=159417 RepID=UPI004041DF4D